MKPNYACNDCGWEGHHTQTTTSADTMPLSGLKRTRRACPKCKSTNITFTGGRDR